MEKPRETATHEAREVRGEDLRTLGEDRTPGLNRRDRRRLAAIDRQVKSVDAAIEKAEGKSRGA